MAVIVKSRRKAPNRVQTSEPASSVTGETWFNGFTVKCRHADGRWIDPRRLEALPGPGAGYGYICGGESPTEVAVSTVERVNFVTGTVGAVNAYLPKNKCLMSPANSKDNLYMFGGLAGTTPYSDIDRLAFPFDDGSSVTQVGVLEAAMRRTEGFNSSTDGYCVGGYDGSGYYSTVRRFDFATEGLTNVTVSRLGEHATTSAFNSSAYGYVVVQSSLERFWFATQASNAVVRSDCLVANADSSACFNSSAHGYLVAGSVSGSAIERVEFPFDAGTAIQVGYCMVDNAYFLSGANSSTAGWFVQGRTYDGTTVTHYSYVGRVDFPFDDGEVIVSDYMNTPRSTLAFGDGVDFVAQFV